MNVLNCLPKAVHALYEIWQAETREAMKSSLDLFIKTYEPKYPEAAICLHKDWEELLASYDFPMQHWQSIRSCNPIESSFDRFRQRTMRSNGCLSRDGMLRMTFKLGLCAEKKWRLLRDFVCLRKAVASIKFIDGVGATEAERAAA